MKDQQPTPETDAVMTDPLRDGNDMPNLARKLERERDEARNELENLKACAVHSCHADCQRPACKARRENKAMREAIKEAHKFALDILHNYECGIEIDLKCKTALAKLQPFITTP